MISEPQKPRPAGRLFVLAAAAPAAALMLAYGAASAAEDEETIGEPDGIETGFDSNFIRPPQNPGDAERGRIPAPERARVLRGEEADRVVSTAVLDEGRVGATAPLPVYAALSSRSGRLPYDIPVVTNGMVEDWISHFQGKGRKYFEKWLARHTKYDPVIREILREEGLPEDTIYLAMIESGFAPFALSRSAAGGIWQFIPGTAKRYSLKIDFWRDERRDPVKSTRAAAAYLRNLYGFFGSWWLAWAGYNSGEGKIFRAMRRYETEDFWEISSKRFLRRETRNYVPKLIAAALIAKSPGQYGFGYVEYMNRLEYDEVEIPSPTDLRAAAKAALSDLQTIEALNPELRRGCTPPNQETYRIRVPRGSSERFLAVLGAMPPEERFKVGQYTAKRGDTLNGVAKTSGVRASILAEYNGLDAKTALKPGTELRIPMVYVRDGETEDKWDKKLNKRLSKMRGKKARAARKTVGSSDLPHGGGG